MNADPSLVESASADAASAAPSDPRPPGFAGSAFEVFRVFLGLGLTSFGGPIAHIAYFRAAFVERRGWIDAAGFAQLLALCQFLPGPASSQLGFAIGLQRAGLAGALAAFVAFTAPSALLLFVQAALAPMLQGPWWEALLQGLKLVAVAAVFLPGFLLLLAVLPFWQRLQMHAGARAALAGINAAVVGLLAAAFADPVLLEGVRSLAHGLIALAGFALLQWSGRSPLWMVVWRVGCSLAWAGWGG